MSHGGIGDMIICVYFVTLRFYIMIRYYSVNGEISESMQSSLRESLILSPSFTSFARCDGRRVYCEVARERIRPDIYSSSRDFIIVYIIVILVTIVTSLTLRNDCMCELYNVNRSITVLVYPVVVNIDSITVIVFSS